MTATEPLTNLPVPVLAEPNAGEITSKAAVVGKARESTQISPVGYKAPAADPRGGQKLCADCDCEIDPDEELCVICWFARNDEDPDGRWVNTDHAGWVYE